MSEQIQRQPQRREQEEVTPEETTFDRSTTDEVMESCDNCLANIDEVLDEVKGRELTESEVYDLGHPDDWDDEMIGALTGIEYDAAADRYEAAYENITGLTYATVPKWYDRCGC